MKGFFRILTGILIRSEAKTLTQFPVYHHKLQLVLTLSYILLLCPTSADVKKRAIERLLNHNA